EVRARLCGPGGARSRGTRGRNQEGTNRGGIERLTWHLACTSPKHGPLRCGALSRPCTSGCNRLDGWSMDTVAALTLLGGARLFLVGSRQPTEGLNSLAGDSLRRALQRLVSGRFSAVASGVLFTAAIQSSSATIFTVIGFVSAGLITFPQALGINI